MSTEYTTINSEVNRGILSITLNRPEKRNALNDQMIREMTEILMQFKSDDSVLGLMLTGSGEAFCAGADLAYLKDLQNKSFQENLDDSNNLKDLLWAIYTFPKPTLALVNGPAVAGGCGLMSVFDIAFASEKAKFGYPEVKIGFVAALVSVFLVESIGFNHAKYLLLSGDIIDAYQAQQIGLVQKVIPHDLLSDMVEEYFNTIRFNSPQAIKLTKELLNRQWANQLKMKLDEAAEFNAKVRQTDDFHEGLVSFLHKREPVWNKHKS